MIFIDLTGKRFGKLTVLHRDGFHTTTGGNSFPRWRCLCDCGKEKLARGEQLRNGTTKSCGCLLKDPATTKQLKHGGSKQGDNGLYSRWTGMIERCNNPASKDYANYGGRGISVCEEWNDYDTYRKWAWANGFRKGLSIDRINNDLGYSPENCRFVSWYVQANNKRNNVNITYNGETHSVSEWERLLGFKQHTLKHRLYKGWTIERALTQPLRGTRYSKEA